MLQHLQEITETTILWLHMDLTIPQFILLIDYGGCLQVAEIKKNLLSLIPANLAVFSFQG